MLNQRQIYQYDNNGFIILPDFFSNEELQGIEIEIRRYQQTKPAIDALKSGQVDAFTTDSVPLSRIAANNPDFGTQFNPVVDPRATRSIKSFWQELFQSWGILFNPIVDSHR